MTERFAVPVNGGMLRGLRWGPSPHGGGPVVVAAHGITSSSRFWTLVGEALAAEVALLAPDLRGRGGCGDLPGPYGIGVHAADVIAVLDAFGLDQAVIAGHSMGGWVAAVTAVRHPDRVAAIALIDGGPPITDRLPPDTDVDAVLEAIVGPSLERLRRTFASRDEYRAFWRGHPAFEAVPGWLVDAYADHDLTGHPPKMHSTVSREAVRADAADTLLDEEVRTAVERLGCPARFLWAERGMLDQPEGLYGAEHARRLPHLEAREVRGVNHFTIGMSERGAAAVADDIRALVTGAGS